MPLNLHPSKNTFKFGSIIVLVFLLSFRPVKDKKIIFIDAAHGGQDIGVYIGNAYEKKIVEDISRKIKSLNKNKEVEIILSRESDVFTDLNQRVEQIKQVNPDLVISLHVNLSADKAASGVTAVVSDQNQHYKASLAHAQNLIQAVENKYLPKREIKNANNLILESAHCAAVSLELGFLSNEKEKDYLMSEKGQMAIAKGILKYLRE